MNRIVSGFAIDVFNEQVMRERLPADIFDAIMQTRHRGAVLDGAIAQCVADAMKEWAIEKGATHYTHWFQPMTGVTAEKHDSFLTAGPDGQPITAFSRKNLIKGESDASSFPSGSLRATFEARGYTTWDPTSDAFIKDGSLYIPSAFCAFSAEALDEKTPLLRSTRALNEQALRVLSALGVSAGQVYANVGPEQEYFLVDKEIFEKRPDLVLTGRTLFGARPPKGQELADHYYGHIKPRVWAFMKDLDEALWRLGVYASTKHNEAAPGQHELAVLYEECNLAVDHNQLVMELLKATAQKHGMVCLLHEKPFARVNGSGKHNNYSLATDTGLNLLRPGDKPQENLTFLVFLCAVIQAVDRFSDLLRITVSSAGNDRRLGGHEAPPSVVSIHLGEHLTGILQGIVCGQTVEAPASKPLETRVDILPQYAADNTDRNRTSPMAFTGNKFEFRMPGASTSVSFTNTVLNAAIADSLFELAELLEGDPAAERTQGDLSASAEAGTLPLNAAPDETDAAHQSNAAPEESRSNVTSEDACATAGSRAWRWVADTVRAHDRVLFNGNNYASQWRQTADERGLSRVINTPQALLAFLDQKNIDLFERHDILTRAELAARQEVLLEEYNKTANMEVLTLLDLAQTGILPAAQAHVKTLCDNAVAKAAAGLMPSTLEQEALAAADLRLQTLLSAMRELQSTLETLPKKSQPGPLATATAATLLPAMHALRNAIDALEQHVPRALWAFPTYVDLLFD